MPVFPLPATIIFPGMTVPLLVFEARYKQLVRCCTESHDKKFVIALGKDRDTIRDESLPFHKVASIVTMLECSENTDGTFSVLGHAQERCLLELAKQEDIAEPDGSLRPLYFCNAIEQPLLRGDPNLERVAAWDALDTFKDYAKTFFTSDSQEQIEEVLPDELVYQASFICANIRVPEASRQLLLETESLSKRFQLAQTLMAAHLKAYKPPTDL